MRRDSCRRGHRTLLGIVLIFSGLLYLMQSLNLLQTNAAHIIFSWGFFMFIIGLLMLSGSHRSWLAIFLIVIGGLLLIPKIFPSISIDDNIIFPLIIICLGLMIIFKKRSYYRWDRDSSRGFTKEKISSDFIDVVSVFGGGHHTITTDSFKGGNITAVFGGSEIDLTNAKLAEGENILDIMTIFGGTTIIVPRGWNIIINATPLFGGFADKSRKDPGIPIDLTRTLVIKGLAIFGGAEIKSY